jgi:hypothetical protein
VRALDSAPLTRKTHKTRSDKLPDSRKVRHNRTRPFISWDGEGYTVNGKHYYALFGNSLGARVQGGQLTYQQCLPLLFDSPKNANHVIFAGTYDVTMMFRDCIQRNAIMSAQWVTVGQYRLRFLKGKSLTVKDTLSGESRTLYDVFSFFGTSFVKACTEYLSLDDEIDGRSIRSILDGVDSMKMQRAEFTGITPEVRDYMTTELTLLVMLCDNLRERLAAVDIHPTRWHGPGAIASTVLKDYQINDYRNLDCPSDLNRAAECAYYGGRFEMFKRGTYIGRVYQYDIRSAYPYAMTHLPSVDGEWFHYERERVKDDYALYLVRRRDLPKAVPFRDEYGTILFPNWCYGWYWGIELPKGIIAQEAFVPASATGYPFQFVSEMYDRRARLKAEGKPEQLALKLALNSLYGKLAQSKGAAWNGKRWNKPTYHEPLWAGYITAYTRSMIQGAIALAGMDNVIAAETDAVFSTVPLDLDIGTGLGQWECTEYDGIKYIQSGVHCTLKDGKWSYKTRGLTMRKSTSETQIWDDLLANGFVYVNQVRFGTDVRANTFGKWYSQRRKLVLDNPNSLEKRINVGRCKHPDCIGSSGRVDYTSHLHPLVVPPIIERQSIPYHFTWGVKPPPLDPTIDDPLLYMEYLPESRTA